MQIGFYEEFPSEKNLKKLKLIKFPSRIFIAAKSVEKFLGFEKIAKSYKKNLDVGYWPILPHSYWISPFSNTRDLVKTFEELSHVKNPILIDLELPFKNKKMILKNSLSFFKNKKLIKTFLEEDKSRITTAEYTLAFVSNFMKFFGLNYNIKYERSIMWYSSMNSKFLNEKIKNNLKRIKDKTNYSISIGTIAKGILGNEPILSTKKLEKDLIFVQKEGFEKVVIFRLEGLNRNYIKVLEKFV